MSGISSYKKDKLLKKKGNHCFYCGDKLTKSWEADHIVPKSKGGGDSYSNLVPSCRDCNAMKYNLTLKSWFKKMKKILKKHTIQAKLAEEAIDLDELDRKISESLK